MQYIFYEKQSRIITVYRNLATGFLGAGTNTVTVKFNLSIKQMALSVGSSRLIPAYDHSGCSWYRQGFFSWFFRVLKQGLPGLPPRDIGNGVQSLIYIGYGTDTWDLGLTPHPKDYKQS